MITLSKIVPTKEYHKYVPATTNIHVPKEKWNGLGLNLYGLSGNNKGINTPGIPDIGLAFMVSGCGIANCSLNGSKWKRKSVHSKSAFLIQPHNTLAWQWREKNLSESNPKTANIFIDNKIFQRLATQAVDIDFTSIEVPSTMDIHDPIMHQLALELLDEASNATPCGKLFGETAAQLIAIQLLRKHCTINYKIKEYKGGLSQRTLSHVLEYINANLDRNISLESLSILTGLSSYPSPRQFKQSTGLAPHQYLVKCRMDKARELLENTNLNIAQVSLEVGYESQSHFTRLFRRLVGVTPKSYRNKI